MYSYKTPRKKPLFSRDSLLWMIFVGSVFTALVTFGLYLYYQAAQYKQALETVESSNGALSQSVMGYEKELKIFKMQQTLGKEVHASNVLLKNSIKNLFDLVPDQIVLTKVMMQKDLLELEGTTPTKDTYRLLLEPPLKSIFKSSQVNYVFNGQLGKYEFKSFNRVADEQEVDDGKK